ncbi:hypothetical protein ABZX65_27585 [Streptomyces sp. NPDC003300]|uniref:hypothetical protein n=1 Tax=unclassified Streptomyces TaxID=2593676 RepID=UPI0033A44D0B
MCLGLVAVAFPEASSADTPEPVAVINGDLALPAISGNGNTLTPTGWSVGSTSANNGAGTASGVFRYAGTVTGHPGGKAAAMLPQNGSSYEFKQRLRGVRPGARVTVTFDDSPGIAMQCAPRTVEQGQTYTVQGEGGAVQKELTEPDPDKEWNVFGAGVWRTGRTYTFTANAYEPLLTFASTVPVKPNGGAAGTGTNGGQCGPMITNITAVQVPPPLDKTIRNNELPPSLAFRGNDKRTVTEAVTECNTAGSRCTFTAESDYSFAYYEPARQAEEGYINCTRATITRERPLRISSRTISDLPAAAGLPPAPGSAARSNMNGQFTTGTGTTPAWAPAADRTVREVISPGEVSWIETQSGRQRTEGWYTSNPTPADPNLDWRLYTVVDHPSTQLADRVYQRTGPLTSGEQARCRSNRPSAETPVDAGAPAAGADRG